MLREAVAWLVAWLCARFDIEVLEAARRPSTQDAIARGEQWRAFYEEEGGLRDMLDAMRVEAFEAASDLPPEETDKIYYWSMSDRITRRLQQRIVRVIPPGQVEAERRESARRNSIAIPR